MLAISLVSGEPLPPLCTSVPRCRFNAFFMYYAANSYIKPRLSISPPFLLKTSIFLLVLSVGRSSDVCLLRLKKNIGSHIELVFTVSHGCHCGFPHLVVRTAAHLVHLCCYFVSKLDENNVFSSKMVNMRACNNAAFVM